MKIVLNIGELYRLMREREIKTIRQLSRESGITCECLYGSVNRGVTSKETYWRLLNFLAVILKICRYLTVQNKNCTY